MDAATRCDKNCPQEPISDADQRQGKRIEYDVIIIILLMPSVVKIPKAKDKLFDFIYSWSTENTIKIYVFLNFAYSVDLNFVICGTSHISLLIKLWRPKTSVLFRANDVLMLRGFYLSWMLQANSVMRFYKLPCKPNTVI